jgi:hypothetical protein
MKSNTPRFTALTCLLGSSLSCAAFAQDATEKQRLSPETEMAIMHEMNKEDRLATRQAVLPKPREGVAWADDVSGEWICFTTMLLNGPTGMGIMQINLEHDGEQLVGEGGQLKHPYDLPSTIRPIGAWAQLTPFVGQFIKHTPKRHNIVIFERQSAAGSWAIFTATISGDGRTAHGPGR